MTQDDRLAAVASVISKHMDDVFGEDLAFVASLVLYAENSPTITFGVSWDSHLFESIKRQARDLVRSLDMISLEGQTFIPQTRTMQMIQQAMSGAPLPPSPIENAQSALRELETWIDEAQCHPELKKQARKGRNWRAASVAATCQRVWAAAKSRPLKAPGERILSGIDTLSMGAAAPSYEKHDSPGPFGRFLEDVNAALGILDKDGHPFPAASALRSLKQARQQKAEN